MAFLPFAYLPVDSCAQGDDDPIDAIEIGSGGALPMGSIVRVKVLGSMELIDEGEVSE